MDAKCHLLPKRSRQLNAEAMERQISSCLTVHNVPHPFMELTFTSTLEKQRRREGILPEIFHIVKSCRDYNRERRTVVVEFIDAAAASKMLKLQKLKFLRTTLNFTMGNLTATDFALNTEVTRMGSPSETTGDHFRVNVSSTVTDHDVSSASFCEDLSDLRETPISLNHKDATESIHIVEPVGSNLKQDEDSVQGFMDLNWSEEDEDNSEHETKFVTVGNLSAPFYEDLFLKYMEKARREAKIGLDWDHVISHCGEFHSESSSVVIEFLTPELANEFIALGEVQYLLEPVKLEKYYPKTEINLISKESKHVLVSQVPSPFQEDLFLKYMEKARREAKIGLDWDHVISHCGEFHSESSSVVIEFLTPELANEFIALGEVQYLLKPVKLEKYYPKTEINLISKESKHVLVSQVPSPFQEDLFLKYMEKARREAKIGLDWDHVISHCGEFHSESSSVVIEGKENGKKSNDLSHIEEVINLDAISGKENDTTKDIPLKSAEGDVIFLRHYLAYRDKFQGGKDHSDGYVKLLVAVGLDGVKTDLPSLNKRRKYFLDIYNLKKRKGIVEYPFWQALAVCFGGASPRTLKGTVFEDCANEQAAMIKLDDPMRVATAAAELSGGAVFTTAAPYVLVSAVKNNYETFQRMGSKDVFWEEVSKLLAEHGHYYTGPRCERRFKDARKLYNDERARRKRTGEPTEDPKVKGVKQWYWSDDMHFIMAKDISTNPHVTISAGSCSRRVLRPVIGESDESGIHPDDPASDQCAVSNNPSDASGSQQCDAEDVGRIGKERVPLLTRPRKKNAKELALYAVAAAMNRRTDVLDKHLSHSK
ncbi:Trihelix transcription factor DF1 [Frankliniella fusca]|uniref:Trihelix transcription factor DF1 n=1 Tax=Frankliniella fusca TaxID=407009 RepID=A0AAE1LNN3_9NEOP|nr:Trihelix transcription factor DF1 [Frankliniella fusca]